MNGTPDGRLPEEQDDSDDLIPFSAVDDDFEDGSPEPAAAEATDTALPETPPAPADGFSGDGLVGAAPGDESYADGLVGAAPGDQPYGDGPVAEAPGAHSGEVGGSAHARGQAVPTPGSQSDATAPTGVSRGYAPADETSRGLTDGSADADEIAHSQGGDAAAVQGGGKRPGTADVGERPAAEGRSTGVGPAGRTAEEAAPSGQDGSPAAAEEGGPSSTAAGTGEGGPDSTAGGAGKGGRRKAVRKAGLVAAGLAVALIAAGVGVIALVKPYLSPADFEGKGEGAVTVRIPPGSSAQAIGTALADAGVVASAQSFVRATEDRAVTGRLRPGTYRLRKGMAATAALDLLLDAASRVVKRVTVPEGMRVSEVLERLAKQTGLPLKDFLAVDKGLVGLPSYAPGLEGFLFPATYEIEPGDSPVDVLAAMVERFGAEARRLRLAEQAARVHLKPLEAVTVASMIQAEGGTDADYPKIARVIYNRLQRGTPLEIDSTVLYAQKRRTLRVSEKDTKVDSPYNTYRRKGLPPGPIANPGTKALVAALNPADGDWHWFVTTDPAHRITKFTNKESEFVRYREELNKNLGTS